MTVQQATNCAAPVELVTLNTAGHQVLNNATECCPTTVATTTLDVTSMMWNFLQQFKSAESPELERADISIEDAPPPSPAVMTPIPTTNHVPPVEPTVGKQKIGSMGRGGMMKSARRSRRMDDD
mmetsp:Transcript_28350/g.46922  ORF Transcript_28350/g.46922 Transcript_28350/m.46922 type:complete len:124 (+) Transcript_28350:2-373(+)